MIKKLILFILILVTCKFVVGQPVVVPPPLTDTIASVLMMSDSTIRGYAIPVFTRPGYTIVTVHMNTTTFKMVVTVTGYLGEHKLPINTKYIVWEAMPVKTKSPN